MSLAVGIKVGQAIETLVVLREAAEAEDQNADAHLHQHSSLIGCVYRQSFGHFDHLDRGLGLLLALAGCVLTGALLRGRWFRWRG